MTCNFRPRGFFQNNLPYSREYVPIPLPSQPSPTSALPFLTALDGTQQLGEGRVLELLSWPEDYLASTCQPHRAQSASTHLCEHGQSFWTTSRLAPLSTSSQRELHQATPHLGVIQV